MSCLYTWMLIHIYTYTQTPKRILYIIPCMAQAVSDTCNVQDSPHISCHSGHMAKRLLKKPAAAKYKASDWRRAGQAARQVASRLPEEKVRAAARGSSSSKGKGPGKGCKGEGKYKDTVNKGKGGKDEGKGKGEARDCISSSSSAPAPKAGAIADEELVADFFCDFSDDEPTQAEQARQALEELRADDWLNPNAKRPQWFIDDITP